MLGGTSAINFLCWTKPPADEIDGGTSFGPLQSTNDRAQIGKDSETRDGTGKHSRRICASLRGVLLSPNDAGLVDFTSPSYQLSDDLAMTHHLPDLKTQLGGNGR